MRRVLLWSAGLTLVGAVFWVPVTTSAAVPGPAARTSPATPAPATTGGAAPTPVVTTAPPPTRAPRLYLVRYTFDGVKPLADVSGHGHDLAPVSRNNGMYSMVAHHHGSALAFPPPCKAEPCPRIALRAGSADELNPLRRPFRYGASVRLRSDETTKGENVLQKGYSRAGSQWKLQIDGKAGRPSCVLVGDTSAAIHLAVSPVSVADGRWHDLECRRSATRLSIWVDGFRRGATVVPASLTIQNRLPLSVGGKGSFTDNDQFQGEIDDVWVRLADK